jgi:hypothetical protein
MCFFLKKIKLNLKLKYTFEPSSSRILEFKLGQNARVRARARTWITPWQAELEQVIPAQDRLVYTPNHISCFCSVSQNLEKKISFLFF